MVKGVFDELLKPSPKNHFTVGINDDVTHTSLDYDPDFSTEADDTVRAVFYGLGADGTVGANKNSIKIIGEETDNLRPGLLRLRLEEVRARSPSPTCASARSRSTPAYLISKANFVACHQFAFLERIDMLKAAEPGATFLLNSPFGPDEVWDKLPRAVQQQIIDKKLKFYVIDAYEVAKRDRHGRPHQHHHADLLLRDLAASCRAKRRSPRSRTPSRRPTASAAKRSCRRTSPPSTPPSPTCTR